MRISVSGIDGSGKTTLCLKLVEWFRARGHPVYFQKLQPTAYQRASAEIVDPDDPRLSSIFFNAARRLDGDPGHAYTRFTNAYLEYVMTLEEVMLFRRDAEAHDRADSFVIHDRHLLDRRVNAKLAGCPMNEIEAIVTLIRPPDVPLLLDLPAEAAEARLLATRGRIAPDESLDVQLKLRAAYLDEAARDPAVQVIDAAASARAVFEQVTGVLYAVFPQLAYNRGDARHPRA